MCSNQLTDYQREHSILMGSTMFREHYGFGLGLAVVMKRKQIWIYALCRLSWLCWWPGAYGGWWSADPVIKAIYIF